MITKKSKYVTSIFLVLIPVFLMYVQYSAVIYHSHIFSSGEYLTHAHPFNDCKKNIPPGSTNNSNSQIVVFHHLVLDLGDNAPVVEYYNFIPSIFVDVIFPVIEIHSTGFFSKKTGRAPPLYFA